jgi:hypothetical protein
VETHQGEEWITRGLRGGPAGLEGASDLDRQLGAELFVLNLGCAKLRAGIAETRRQVLDFGLFGRDIGLNGGHLCGHGGDLSLEACADVIWRR